jgi:HEAT repeat protein
MLWTPRHVVKNGTFLPPCDRIRRYVNQPHDEQALLNLAGELSRADGDAPRDAIERLVAASEAAVGPLIGLLGEIEPDEDDWGPLWITVVLGEIRSPRAVDSLLKLLELPEGDVLSEAAVEALAKTGKPALPALTRFAREARSWEARHYAYAALGLIPSDESFEFLVSAIDRDPLLWSTLAIALADLGDARAVVPLKALLSRCDKREAPAVREAIDIIEGRQPPYPKLHTRYWRERYAWLSGVETA